MRKLLLSAVVGLAVACGGRMRWLAVLAGLVLACSDGSGPPGRDDANLNGNWYGTLTNSAAPDVTFTALLLVVQDEAGDVQGTLEINNGRLYVITDGQVVGGALTATLDHDGSCGGTIDLEAEAVAGDTRLEGTYFLSDCEDDSDGTFRLTRQQ